MAVEVVVNPMVGGHGFCKQSVLGKLHVKGKVRL